MTARMKPGRWFVATAMCWMTVAYGNLADELLAGTRCSEVVMGQLAEWHSAGEFLLSPNSVDDVTVLRSPTAQLGIWIVLSIQDGNVVRMLRASPELETAVRLDDACQLVTSTHRRPSSKRSESVLTDDDVARILGQNRSGVFFAWSPHMPLSVEGYTEIATAAERLGISVTPVLSSHANIGYAKDRALRIEMPDEAFAINHSIELTMRDFNVHAPAILIYASGEFISPVIPGFRNAADYATLIPRFLKD